MSQAAQREKMNVVRRIEALIGPTHPSGRGRTFWRVSADNSKWVYVLYSKANQLWFGVRPAHLDDGLSYPTAYFAFVLGTSSDVLVVPLPLLRKIIRDHGMELKGSDEYQFHVRVKNNRYEFSEAPGVDLTPYHNDYESLAR